MGSLKCLSIAPTLLSLALTQSGTGPSKSLLQVIDAYKRDGFGVSIDRKTWHGTISKGGVKIGVSLSPGIGEKQAELTMSYDATFLLPSAIDRKGIESWFKAHGQRDCELTTQVNDIVRFHADYISVSDLQVIPKIDQFWATCESFKTEFRAKETDPWDISPSGREPAPNVVVGQLSWGEFQALQRFWGWDRRKYSVNALRTPAPEARDAKGWLTDWTVVNGVEIGYGCGMRPSSSFVISAYIPANPESTEYVTVGSAIPLPVNHMTVGQFKQAIIEFTERVKKPTLLPDPQALAALTRASDLIYDVRSPGRDAEVRRNFDFILRLDNANLLKLCWFEMSKNRMTQIRDWPKFVAQDPEAEARAMRGWKEMVAIFVLNRYAFQLPPGGAAPPRLFNEEDFGNRMWPWIENPNGSLTLGPYTAKVSLPFWGDPLGEITWLCEHGKRRASHNPSLK